jgi:hypothetical protein
MGDMLHEFLTANREEILVRARRRGGVRSATSTTELSDGLPLFLDQLGDALLLATAAGQLPTIRPRNPPRPMAPPVLSRGLAIDHAIHGYGDIGRAITELAIEKDAPISVEESVAIDLCLDEAIACALTASAEPEEV